MIQPLTITKTSNVSEAIVGEIVNYSIKIVNTTGTNLRNVKVKSLCSLNLFGLENSVKVNGFSLESGDILRGINIGTIEMDKTTDITFDAKILGSDDDGYVKNQIEVTFEYQDSNDNLDKIEMILSEINYILVKIADISIVKEAKLGIVTLKDTIEYKITVENIGTIDGLNIILKDIMDSAVELIEGSVKVNNVVTNNVNFKEGLNIGGLKPKEKAIIEYKVSVIGGTCSGYIKNKAYIIYNYVLSNGNIYIKENESLEVKIPINIYSFKQLVLDKYCVLPKEKQDIEEVDDVDVKVVMDDSYVIDTLNVVSNEGHILSGNKLIFHGVFKINIEYTASLPTQPTHSLNYEMPFSTFLILPSDYKNGMKIEVTDIVENVDINMFTAREIVVNIVALIVAKTN